MTGEPSRMAGLYGVVDRRLDSREAIEAVATASMVKSTFNAR